MNELLQNERKIRREILLDAFAWVSSIGEQFFDSSKTVEDMVNAYEEKNEQK